MDSWNNNTTTTTHQLGFQFPNHIQTKHFGLDNDLVELLWQDGELVLHNQIHKKQTYDEYDIDPSKSKQDDDDDDDDNHIASWIDESFDKEFCANFLSEIPSSPNHVTSQHPPPSSPIPEIGTFHHHHNSGGGVNLHQLPVLNRTEQGGVPECSVITVGSSNQVDMSWASSSCGIGSRAASTGAEEKCARKISPCSERETVGQAITSCSGGTSQSNTHKRKSRDVEESECRSDATELESASGKKSRRIRVAQVHNLSERRRRDRINEKMKALQELIPHSNKSDKASMLDEAIEYMKSLQLQLQLMWMGSGMQYMGPAMFQNMMRLSSRSPFAMNISNQAQMVNYSNQMQNPSFQEQYANYMAFHSAPNTSQAMNMFNFGSHSAQQNQVSAPRAPGDGNR